LIASGNLPQNGPESQSGSASILSGTPTQRCSKANGEDVKVVQELMRHANIISTTMNIYTKALTSAKREAQSRVVDVRLDRSRNVSESAAEDAA
jgi:predicted RecB family nuclease